ncbi:putative nicotinate-nucleotide adenylyltransferase [Thiosulfatimonas sediminis]|uniref:Probable nicotinate-nucleotide adenylyltransferase n=1 Tax=Thiosulfatimonas sediminis TaxID=2675054 RepID=A0A6F8PX38_9GAMM|nr:nicotinate-nucleotide adenylyltransferase [Thiosulfatimonas sediminis]BBP46713.1 putative nicotinate-nucleotide adenylyltransferase [Thiosulfatimonas sediminis]
MRFIGINGGTFDPIHYGHLRAALEVMQKVGMEQVRFVPCYQPVHRGTPSVSAQQRCAMIALAIEAQPQFFLDTIEIERGGPSFMVDTLRQLKPHYADGSTSLVLMMGMDAYGKFCTWHQWQEILELANLVVMHRPGDNLGFAGQEARLFQQRAVTQFSQLYGQIMELPITQLAISSTAIRADIRKGIPPDYLTPFRVNQYIQKYALYRAQPDEQ